MVVQEPLEKYTSAGVVWLVDMLLPMAYRMPFDCGAWRAAWLMLTTAWTPHDSMLREVASPLPPSPELPGPLPTT